jgi:hypothetical protein
MNKSFIGGMVVGIAILAVVVGLLWMMSASKSDEVVTIQALSGGMTNLSGLTISGSNTDELIVNQTGTGDIVELRDNGAAVVRVPDGGGVVLLDGDLTVADDIRISAQTAITVTNGNPFTPTGTYQAITAASEVTPTITVGNAGDVLVLINTSAQTVNIADTGTAKLSAAAALGQYDTLVLWCDGTNWIEISRSDN